MDFKDWMMAVDELLTSEIGLTTSDLADATYWDSWNDELTPADMVESLRDEEGWAE